MVGTRASAQVETVARELETRARSRAAPRCSPAPGSFDVLGLQRSAGNRATARMLAGLRTSIASPVLQRAIIPAAGIHGLAGNLDTSNLDASKAQIDQMWNGGTRKGLSDLWVALRQVTPEL
ncbi:MAG TPA: hypothetical protein VG295_14800, partial [Solirubrobacteraceae bacterium]|nr:hypothetical protein [Solirubrobacteraceae bacterium]